MTFNSPEEFEPVAKKVIEDAIHLIHKNKKVEVYLNSGSKAEMRSNGTFLFNYSLHWPKRPEAEMSLRSNWFDFSISDPKKLPLIPTEIQEGLEKLHKSISDLDYITACVATWIYSVAKHYRYF